MTRPVYRLYEFPSAEDQTLSVDVTPGLIDTD